MNETMTLISLNAIAVWLIEKFKASSAVPWVTAESERANKWLSIAFSTLASAGIVFTYTHTGTVANGAITISWAGISVAHVVSFLYHSVAYFATQKTMFKVWKYRIAETVPKSPIQKA